MQVIHSLCKLACVCGYLHYIKCIAMVGNHMKRLNHISMSDYVSVCHSQSGKK